MRQVFSSPRLENVEAVADLLRAEGIAVRISDGRSYHGTRRSNFSYSETAQSGPQPAVWILNAEDQPRGRELLRDAGLLESTRVGESSYLPLSTMHESNKDSAARNASKRSGTRTRLRIGLLVLIVVVSALIWYSRRDAPPATTNKTPLSNIVAAPAAPKHPAPTIIPQQAEDLEVYRADVPTALAKLLIEGEFKASRATQACIAIDGADPSPEFIQSLAQGSAAEVFAGSDCPKDVTARTIAVHDYMTDGLGRGHVQLESGTGKPREVEVERDGVVWRIVSKR